MDRIDARLLEITLFDDTRAPPGRGAAEKIEALLRRAVELEHAERVGGDGALGADADRAAALTEDLVALGVDEVSGRRGRELPVTRVADAGGGTDAEEAVSGDRKVKRLVGLPQRGRRQIGRDLVDPGACTERADRLAGRRVLQQQ